MIPPLFAHQVRDLEVMRRTPHVFDMSDPGTGKTRKCIELIRNDAPHQRTLVLCPKSIMRAAWGHDIDKFAPHVRWAVAAAPKREAAFASDAQVVIANHDAAKWLRDNAHLLDRFHRLIVDESTAFKNADAQRAKSLRDLAALFDRRILLSGTPNPNGILDLWHQFLILDGGQRLGRSFYRFRSTTCEAQTKFTKRLAGGRSVDIQDWTEKPGAVEAVFALVQDITLRNRLEDCIDIPENHTYTVGFELSKQHAKLYREAVETAKLTLKDGKAAPLKQQSLWTKLLQIASGAVYTDSGTFYDPVAPERYELILDLAEARPQSLVAFNWRHQRDELTALAKKRGLAFGLIDGSVDQKDREQAVRDFQTGKLRILFAHPQSAGHGLTLTAGTATIWSSPTYNLEHFEQFNRRIYRAGQTQRTETIMVCAVGTLEEQVYARLGAKKLSMDTLLELL